MTKEEIILKLKADMELRGRSPSTIRDYMAKVRLYQDFYDKPADQMREPEIAEYLHYLLADKKIHGNSVNVYNSVFRFVYGVTLDMVINYKKIPRIKQIRTLPQLLTKDEIRRIIDCASNLQHKAMFMLAYGSGLRLSEITHLKVSDIDSKQMRIFVSQGKGSRDRYAMLPQATLEILRNYWREYRPQDWLFVAPRTGGKYNERTLQDAFKAALKRSGVQKEATVHTLRHNFATDLFNEGNNLLSIKKLLGHVRIDTTAWYTQIADSNVFKLKSPIDSLPKKRGRKPKEMANA